MRIRWHGHSCFEISDDVTVVTDPHDGRSIGIKPPRVSGDIVLVSHDHFDHNCTRMVHGFNIKEIATSGRKKVKEIEILGIETFHDEVGGAKRGKNIVFRFKMGDITFCHLGDLGHVPEPSVLEKLKPVDVLFTPVGNVFTIDADKAWEIAEALSPRVVIPMHYRVGGLSLSIKPVDDFLSLAPKDSILKVGNEIEFIKDDFEEDMDVWVFSL